MSRREKIHFHTDRALTELDCAFAAASLPAARAHFGLSALHLERLTLLKSGKLSIAESID